MDKYDENGNPIKLDFLMYQGKLQSTSQDSPNLINDIEEDINDINKKEEEISNFCKGLCKI